MSKAITLKPKEEKVLLQLAKKGLKLYNEKKKVPKDLVASISSLIYYNQNLVKYIVRGYSFSFFSGQIDYEDLVAEGTTSLLKAIEKFDLNSKSRFATYAGYWIRQYIQSFINKSQFINQSSTIKEKKNVVFYDSNYQNDDKESKSYSLADTLEDKENSELTNEQIRQKDTVTQINNLINLLEKREAILLIRLSYKILPSNLLDVYYIANEKEKEELKKMFKVGKKKDISLLQNYSLQDKKVSSSPIVENYLTMFSQNYKFSELVKLLDKSENSARRLKKDSFKKLQDLAKEKNLSFF